MSRTRPIPLGHRRPNGFEWLRIAWAPHVRRLAIASPISTGRRTRLAVMAPFIHSPLQRHPDFNASESGGWIEGGLVSLKAQPRLLDGQAGG